MVILDVMLARGFSFTHLSYIYKGSGLPVVGARVEVPLGATRSAVGLICGVRAPLPDDPTTLKPAIELWDRVPLFPPQTIELFRFLSAYYMAPLGDVLRALVPIALWKAEFAPKEVLRRNRFTKKAPTYLEAPELNYSLDRSVVLVHGVLAFEQRIELVASLHAQGGGQTLVLVPSEGEARAWTNALKGYAPTACFHAELSVASRSELWVRLATAPKADRRIIVATRAGVALPFTNLKKVVVWDEPSYRYKSGTSPRYSARDAALVLAAKHGAQTVLVSDTPSVETYFNARSNDSWQYVALPSDDRPLRWIAPEHGRDLQSKYLMRRIGEALGADRRAVVFQNRRGWSSAWVCRSCGGAVECPWCRTPATLHKGSHTMRCRTCGYRFDEPEACPECGAIGTFQAQGYGTERIADGLLAQFPDISVARIDSDTDQVPEAPIVVGTQKLLDEGVDWTGVGVVGVANADNLEVGSDFRSAEEAFRILARLAARARTVDAELVLQTRHHDRPLFRQATQDHEEFYRAELLHRKSALYPPFSRLIEFEFRGESLPLMTESASALEARLRQVFADRLSPLFQPQNEVQLGQYVIKLLLKIERGRSSDQAKARIAAILQKTKLPKGITLAVVVDPQ